MSKIPAPEQLPSGSWRIRLSYKGKRYSVTASSRRECEVQARQKRNELYTLEEENRIENITLGAAIDRYIDTRDSILSPSTIAQYRSYRRHHLTEVMDLPVAEIHGWQALINEESKRYAPKTIANLWGLIVPVLAECGQNAPKLRLPAIPDNSIDCLMPSQIRPFLAAVRGDKYEVPYLLALHSCRVSEIVAMKRENITKTHIRVRGARVRGEHSMVDKDANKTNKSARTIPIMIPRLLEIIDDFDFSLLTMKIPEVMTRHLYVLMKRAGMPKTGMQELRRTFCSLCVYNKISMQECMEWGGWTNIGTMHKHYIKISQMQKDSSVNNLKEFFIENTPM